MRNLYTFYISNETYICSVGYNTCIWVCSGKSYSILQVVKSTHECPRLQTARGVIQNCNNYPLRRWFLVFDSVYEPRLKLKREFRKIPILIFYFCLHFVKPTYSVSDINNANGKTEIRRKLSKYKFGEENQSHIWRKPNVFGIVKNTDNERKETVVWTRYRWDGVTVAPAISYYIQYRLKQNWAYRFHLWICSNKTKLWIIRTRPSAST